MILKIRMKEKWKYVKKRKKNNQKFFFMELKKRKEKKKWRNHTSITGNDIELFSL